VSFRGLPWATVGILIRLLFISQQKSRPIMVSGIVEAYEVRVGSRVARRVLKVLVEEDIGVHAGKQARVSRPVFARSH